MGSAKQNLMAHRSPSERVHPGKHSTLVLWQLLETLYGSLFSNADLKIFRLFIDNPVVFASVKSDGGTLCDAFKNNL
jgi:hypothetical protein